MARHKDSFTIGIPVYEGVDLLDVAAPYETFNWMAESWKEKKTSVLLVGERIRAVRTRDRFRIVPDTTFKRCPQLDLIWVPGAAPANLEEQMLNCAMLDFLRRQSANARYVASVCEGAFLLASAGLLDGHRATTHWAFVGCLGMFPGIEVAPGAPRYIISGNRVTGGGISSGLDEALQIVALVAGEQVARSVQLTMQYFPDPPFTQQIPISDKCAVRGMPAAVRAALNNDCGG